MENRGFLFKVQDIINKMKKLRQKYKTDKDKNNKKWNRKEKALEVFSEDG